MDKTGNNQPAAAERASLLAAQVVEGRYFFLELAPKRAAGVVLAFGGRENCRPDYRVMRTSYGYHVIEFVAQGMGWVRLDGRRHALEPGMVFSYGPGSRTEIVTDPLRPLVKYFLCLGGRGVAERLRRARLPVHRAMHLGAPGDVRSVFDDLIREGQWHGPLTREVCATLGELLLLKIEAAARAAAGAGTELARESFLRCKALIDANAERLLSLQDVARAAGFDVSTVCRLFRRFQGASPYQYLLRRKMNLAAAYLMESGGLVKQAAQQVGFADAYHFSRVFKAVHGVAPSDLQGYRRDRRQGGPRE